MSMLQSRVQKPILQNLVNPYSLIGILLQNSINKGFSLQRNLSRVVVMHIPYALHRLLTTDIVKWRLSAYQLIREDTNAPNIDTVIISLTLDNLGRNVIESAAVSCPSALADGSPSEITQLTYILNKDTVTLVMTMFSGFMSLCKMELSCIYFKPRQISFSFYTVYASVSFFFFFMRPKRLPPSMYSIMI